MEAEAGGGAHAGAAEHGATAAGPKSLDSHPMYPCAKLKLDQLFLQWLSLPDSQALVSGLVEDAKAGRALKGPSSSSSSFNTPLSPTTSHAIFASTPPLSPQKCRSPCSPMSPARRHTCSSTLRRAPLAAIPQFYFPGGAAPVSDDVRALFAARVNALFDPHPAGLNLEQFSAVVQEVCQLPTILAHPWFERLVSASPARLVSKEAFVGWWTSRGLVSAPATRRLWEVLRPDGKQHLTYADFRPLLQAVLQYHPGLEFLADTPEFQARYAETVIYRIFYTINRSGSGRMSFRELRRSDLLDALFALEREEDINRVSRYFSYEHFYVVYCKFWELDSDHDFSLDRTDLARYANCGLTYQIVERIFEEAPRKFSSGVPGKMGYEDFVWFILSEEDKTTETAMEYWFRCADLDCDGVITPSEMWHFYEEQMKRLEGLSQEPVLFEDVLCQLHDMLQPEREGCYTLADVRRTRPASSLLFNTMFNLHKFMAYENRDPFALRAEQLGDEGQPLSDWDRFARGEYLRLAVEEEPEDMQVDAGEDMWGGGARGAGAGAGGKMLTEEGDGDDDLVPGLAGTPAAAAGAGAEFVAAPGAAAPTGDGGSATAMDAAG
ncbi:B''ALPHA [Scenedesmus sp. PABB004]|nr:B''ALPHA [Scenedesmus sp. PABB004]